MNIDRELVETCVELLNLALNAEDDGCMSMHNTATDTICALEVLLENEAVDTIETLRQRVKELEALSAASVSATWHDEVVVEIRAELTAKNERIRELEVREQDLSNQLDIEAQEYRRLEAKLATLKQGQGEPVRWTVDNGEDVLCFENATQAEHYAEKWGFVVVSLYTSAPTIPEIAECRDAILNGRGALEAVLDGDQTNAVLAVFDDYLSAAPKYERNL